MTINLLKLEIFFENRLLGILVDITKILWQLWWDLSRLLCGKFSTLYRKSYFWSFDFLSQFNLLTNSVVRVFIPSREAMIEWNFFIPIRDIEFVIGLKTVSLRNSISDILRWNMRILFCLFHEKKFLNVDVYSADVKYGMMNISWTLRSI